MDRNVTIEPYSDKPLVYKIADDGFMLYGVSENFIDDGGNGRDDKTGFLLAQE